MSDLFKELKIKDIVLKNRIALSPMCQYSSVDGFANDWHMVHLGSRTVGGFGLIICEATSVSPEGRISPDDLGIWSDDHIEPLLKINKFIQSNNSISGIQIAHAGRKASTMKSWEKNYHSGSLTKEEGGWETLAPSAIPFSKNYISPKEMSEDDINKVINDFKNAAKRALEAGFKWLEIHAAHGYLLNSFLSPLANQRSDKYGGKFENRIRILLEVINEIKKVWKDSYPIAIRISASDWVEGGWNIEDSIALSRIVKDYGIDLIDCSSGGMSPDAKIDIKPGYQVQFSEAIKNNSGILTGAVGLITDPKQADEIISKKQADLIFLGREALRDPYWVIRAAKELNESYDQFVPEQYKRAF